MRSIHLLLDEAEREWRSEVKRDFPLRGDTKVITATSTKAQGHRGAQRDWSFFTDLKNIHALVLKDKSLRKKFAETVTKYWDGEPESLALDTLHYLLFHELYHPLFAPFSVEGEDNDNKKIHQAIRRGLLRAEPNLSPLEQVVKVQASQNGVKDFILDDRFFLDNQQHGYVRSDIIPVWDLLELDDADPATNFYTITRLLYGSLYGPSTTHSFFEEKSGKKGMKIAEQAVEALIGETVCLPRSKQSLVDRAKALVSKDSDDISERLRTYASAVDTVFSGTDRYRGIERFMSILGPYVEQGMPQGRPDMQGEGTGTSPQNILQDILDDMSSEEQQEFVQQLAQESGGALEQAASQTQVPSNSSVQPASTNQSNIDEMKHLDVLAAHEFYKRNHPVVRVLSSQKVGERISVGKQEYWDLRKTSVLTLDQLRKINLGRIDMLQRKTRLPWLIDLGNKTYRLNEYEVKSRDLQRVTYVDATISVPDMVELYVDSSGSMFGGTHGRYQVNDGSRWDMLSHVLYGFVDALIQGEQHAKSRTRMRIHNFAERTVRSDPVLVREFWEGRTSILQVLFKPENGYSDTCLDIDDSTSHTRKTAYVIVTDGQLSSGSAPREAEKMKRLGRNPHNDIVLFEIGETYNLGKAVINDPNMVYHQVRDKGTMLSVGIEVLLRK